VASTASAGAHAIKAVNTNTGTGFAAGPGIRVLASGGTDADFNGYWPAAGEFSGPNGVVAVANEAGGDGVYGYSGSGYGVYGQSNSDAGVYGVCESGYGVYGVNDAANFGGNAAVRAKGEQNHGLVATTSNVNAYAIKATNTNTLNSAGIRALAGGGTDADIDGLGQSHGAGEFSGPNGVVAVSGGGCGVYASSDSGYGVYSSSASGTGIQASSDSGDGVAATTAGATSHAIRATNTSAGTDVSAGAGIRVLAGGGTDSDIDGQFLVYPAAGEFCGAFGVVAVASEAQGYGVYGQSESGKGVYGTSDSGTGVHGDSNSNIGVYGYSDSGYGVYSNGNAKVLGDLTVTGTLSKAGGSFKIDHPLDPANKFLYHSFIESPDMLNVYSGTITLDAKGEATVTLPDWFEALNRDYRYQLTAIGQAAPDLHVKSEVKDSAFSIAGGASGQKVSWQLTGIRQDAWANAHRIPVEEEKPADERGLYLHPTEHGQPADKGIEAVRIAAMRPHASK
jgi:hypothetical protein